MAKRRPNKLHQHHTLTEHQSFFSQSLFLFSLHSPLLFVSHTDTLMPHTHICHQSTFLYDHLFICLILQFKTT